MDRVELRTIALIKSTAVYPSVSLSFLEFNNKTFAFRERDFAMPSATPRRARQGTTLVHRDPQEYTKTCLKDILVRKSGLGYGCISFP